jgi:lactoylglutathione lyase
MKYLHTMVRVTDVEKSLRFYRDLLGLKEVRRHENEKGRYHPDLPRASRPGGRADRAHLQLGSGGIHRRAQLRPPRLRGRRHLRTCQKLMDAGVTINRPPRDGHMAFVRSPDNISIEILQKGGSLPPAGAVEVDAEHRARW